MEADSSPDAVGKIGTGRDLEPQQPAKKDTDEKKLAKKIRTTHNNPPKQTQARKKELTNQILMIQKSLSN